MATWLPSTGSTTEYAPNAESTSDLIGGAASERFRSRLSSERIDNSNVKRRYSFGNLLVTVDSAEHPIKVDKCRCSVDERPGILPLDFNGDGFVAGEARFVGKCHLAVQSF